MLCPASHTGFAWARPGHTPGRCLPICNRRSRIEAQSHVHEEHRGHHLDPGNASLYTPQKWTMQLLCGESSHLACLYQSKKSCGCYPGMRCRQSCGMSSIPARPEVTPEFANVELVVADSVAAVLVHEARGVALDKIKAPAAEADVILQPQHPFDQAPPQLLIGVIQVCMRTTQAQQA